MAPRPRDRRIGAPARLQPMAACLVPAPKLTMKIDKAIKALSRGKTLQKHSRDFRHAVSVVDGGTQDLGWIAEPRINITLVNLNKAKRNPKTVRIMA